MLNLLNYFKLRIYKIMNRNWVIQFSPIELEKKIFAIDSWTIQI